MYLTCSGWSSILPSSDAEAPLDIWRKRMAEMIATRATPIAMGLMPFAASMSTMVMVVVVESL